MTNGKDEPRSPKAALREVLLTWGGITAVLSVGYHLGAVVPFLARNLGGFAALLFIYFSMKRIEDDAGAALADFGVTGRPWLRSLAWGVGSAALVLAGFAAGYLGYYHLVCSRHILLLGPLGRSCASFRGLGAPPVLPSGFAVRIATELVAVALPEEMFYRGYVQTSLDRALGTPYRLLGARVGMALPIQAVLFGLGHFLVDFNPLRLAVAIPALLFGYLRAKTGNIVSGVVLHASSNLVVLVLDHQFFGT